MKWSDLNKMIVSETASMERGDMTNGRKLQHTRIHFRFEIYGLDFASVGEG